jgi:hypothetical protein
MFHKKKFLGNFVDDQFFSAFVAKTLAERSFDEKKFVLMKNVADLWDEL